LLVEWSKSGARAARWSEDVTLLLEEMRRVLWFLKWKRQWWMDQGRLRHNAREDVREGLVAYSCKQAAILDSMARRFADDWYPFLSSHGMATEWPEEYLEGRLCNSEGMIRQEMEEEDDDAESEMEDDMFD
jgi:hypothetical protein